jgi:hypothetical protein
MMYDDDRRDHEGHDKGRLLQNNNIIIKEETDMDTMQIFASPQNANTRRAGGETSLNCLSKSSSLPVDDKGEREATLGIEDEQDRHGCRLQAVHRFISKEEISATEEKEKGESESNNGDRRQMNEGDNRTAFRSEQAKTEKGEQYSRRAL